MYVSSDVAELVAPRCHEAVKAVRQIVLIPIVEQHDWRELNPFGHPLGIFRDYGLVDGGSDLGAGIEGDGGQLDPRHRTPPVGPTSVLPK